MDTMQNLSCFHLSRRVPDENRACSVSIVFSYEVTDPYVGRAFLLCSRDPTMGTNKNRVLEIQTCEWTLTKKHLAHWGYLYIRFL